MHAKKNKKNVRQARPELRELNAKQQAEIVGGDGSTPVTTSSSIGGSWSWGAFNPQPEPPRFYF